MGHKKSWVDSETHATRCNEGDPNKPENRLLERSVSTFRLQKEQNSRYYVVAFVYKANVFSSNISASHIKMEEIQNFTSERRSFSFTCLNFNRVCFLLGSYMWFMIYHLRKSIVMHYFFFFSKEQQSM